MRLITSFVGTCSSGLNCANRRLSLISKHLFNLLVDTLKFLNSIHDMRWRISLRLLYFFDFIAISNLILRYSYLFGSINDIMISISFLIQRLPILVDISIPISTCVLIRIIGISRITSDMCNILVPIFIGDISCIISLFVHHSCLYLWYFVIVRGEIDTVHQQRFYY